VKGLYQIKVIISIMNSLVCYEFKVIQKYLFWIFSYSPDYKHEIEKVKKLYFKVVTIKFIGKLS
jgi:hypothetical protein